MTWQNFILSLLDQNSFSKYNSDQRESLIGWLMPNFERFYKSLPVQVHFVLRSLKFVPISDDGNVLESPDSLFNPSVQKLKDLFVNESKFPKGKYSRDPLLKILKELGLQEGPQPRDIVESAKRVQTDQSLSSGDSRLKSNAIVYWLETMAAQNLLSQDEVRQLQKIPFLRVLETPPNDYPKGLVWAGSLASQFSSPKCCGPKSFTNLVASSFPISETEIASNNLLTIFDWKTPSVSNVVQHLKNLSKLDCKSMDRFEKKKVTKMLEEIYRNFSRYSSDVFEHLSGFNWIWNGEGFSSPKEICFNSGGLDLKPYLFNIPDEFKIFEKIFIRANAVPNLTADILIGILNSVKKFHDNDGGLSRQNDLGTVVAILNWFADRKTKDDRILVPVQNPDLKLDLKPILECMYAESVGFLDDFSDETEGRIFVIHHNVSINLAKALAVPSMTQQVLNAVPFGFEGFGQHEPLTQRIQNILEEYEDKAGTFKEPLQNADDAGATQVVFVIDHRNNSDWMSSLINPGMKECQGSALWVYNNAEFTETDFANIQKLGGQTKKEMEEKIGRFGIGFNAVYHVTDVPSFVSGKDFVFLDPCLTHLKEAIRNTSRPGIKFDFTKNKNLKKFRDQFEPFKDMFGCNIVPTDGKTAERFKGTLFRLPFRTHLQVLY